MLGNQHIWAGALLGAGATALVLAALPSAPDSARLLLPAGPLLSSGQTVVGERIVYPAGAPAQVTAAVVTLAPGQETGWHTHGVPTLGYVIEGALEVDYGEAGVRTYQAGEAMLEAIAVPHNGRNVGAGPVRILAVFVGADGLKTTEAAFR